MTVCMIGLAVYLQLVPNNSQTALDNRHLSIIPLILLMIYVVRLLRHSLYIREQNFGISSY
jgi:hypothetical protein